MYRTQDDENLLFWEVARVLLEHGFVHPRPLVMPKNMASFIIVTFEGLKVDWLVIVANSLRVGIVSVMDGKKAWGGLAQWLTILVPPTCVIKPKKRARPKTTPNTSSKWQQLLAKHNPGWTSGDSSQREEEVSDTRRQEPIEKVPERMAKPIKIKLHRHDKHYEDLIEGYTRKPRKRRLRKN